MVSGWDDVAPFVLVQENLLRQVVPDATSIDIHVNEIVIISPRISKYLIKMLLTKKRQLVLVDALQFFWIVCLEQDEVGKQFAHTQWNPIEDLSHYHNRAAQMPSILEKLVEFLQDGTLKRPQHVVEYDQRFLAGIQRLEHLRQLCDIGMESIWRQRDTVFDCVQTW